MIEPLKVSAQRYQEIVREIDNGEERFRNFNPANEEACNLCSGDGHSHCSRPKDHYPEMCCRHSDTGKVAGYWRTIEAQKCDQVKS